MRFPKSLISLNSGVTKSLFPSVSPLYGYYILSLCAQIINKKENININKPIRAKPKEKGIL